ncbi:helix-turn-helix transcriptional regulator [Herbiconiux sp. UC225_62]|uniref:helix-turn-helix transcriptional regulator n=1 Tax=Herbiconiux sp. UC225_62 TaxID=3350168 RepID=UPI0036D362B5
MRALPETFRADAEAAASAVVIDPADWGRTGRRRPAFVETLQAAVVQERVVRIRYAGWAKPEAEYLVSPWGLVEKNEVWYLIGGVEGREGERTFRVDRMRSVSPTEERGARPDDFDLGAAWERVVASVERERASVAAIAVVESPLLAYLRSQFGQNCEVLEQLPDGRSRVRIAAPTATMIAQQLAGWGAFAEVLSPPSVREELASIAAQLTGIYSSTS